MRGTSSTIVYTDWMLLAVLVTVMTIRPPFSRLLTGYAWCRPPPKRKRSAGALGGGRCERWRRRFARVPVASLRAPASFLFRTDERATQATEVRARSAILHAVRRVKAAAARAWPLTISATSARTAHLVGGARRAPSYLRVPRASIPRAVSVTSAGGGRVAHLVVGANCRRTDRHVDAGGVSVHHVRLLPP
eukprot:6890165-Pyramimonas_sp.AAC.2